MCRLSFGILSCSENVLPRGHVPWLDVKIGEMSTTSEQPIDVLGPVENARSSPVGTLSVDGCICARFVFCFPPSFSASDALYLYLMRTDSLRRSNAWTSVTQSINHRTPLLKHTTYRPPGMSYLSNMVGMALRVAGARRIHDDVNFSPPVGRIAFHFPTAEPPHNTKYSEGSTTA